jgi:hypothetical protein
MLRTPTEIASHSFSAFDWNFDAVSDSELVACCYWEYARESLGIRELQRRGFGPDFCGETDSEHGRIGRGLYVVSFRRCAVFREGFFQKRLFPRPWQSLSAGERKSMVSGRLLGKSPAFRRSTADTTLQLVRHYDQKLKRYVMQPSARLISAYGLEFTTVEIDWRANSNEEIVQSFRKWVRANRPKQIPKPHRRGRDKNVSYRVDLERLGILRLLKRCRLPELRESYPEAWKRYNTPNRRWQRDAEKARARFHSLFPFLSDTENPISWPPKR